MAKTHRNLDYESRDRQKLNLVVPFLSNKLYKLDKAIGKGRVDDCVWTYTVGITFRDLTEDEFAKCKKVFQVTTLDKDISEYGVKFHTNKYDTGLKVQGKPITLSLEFRWDLPDTCEIEYVDEWKEVDAQDIKIENDVFLRKETHTKVNCNESTMMKAIFKKQVSNGV